MVLVETNVFEISGFGVRICKDKKPRDKIGQGEDIRYIVSHVTPRYLWQLAYVLCVFAIYLGA